MSIPDEHKGKFFFHFTHINNLEEIIKEGLLSTNEKIKKKISHLNVASKDIQCTRHQMQVSCGNGGYVHDYVPFYFCPRTPMFLSIIRSRNFDQPYFIHLAVSIEKLTQEKFIFTNKAANRRFEPPEFYDSPSKLNKLNWTQIESRAWGARDDSLKHQKMAEALCYKNFDICDVDYIVVWDKSYGDEIRRLFEENEKKCPPIYYDGENRYYHYYYDLNYGSCNSLVHGPFITRRTFRNIVKRIHKARKHVREDYPFDDIESCISAIRADFSCIAELNGIRNLPTDNSIHKSNVEKHTKEVVQALLSSDEYNSLSDREKLVVELAAYLHDIGKGPRDRWKDGIQKVDDDHPRKSAKYLERFLIEDIDTISKNEIRQIVLIVMYHDFIGDHLISGRYLSELKEVIELESDFKLLYALCKADVMAIHSPWYTDKENEWKHIYDTIQGYLDD